MINFGRERVISWFQRLAGWLFTAVLLVAGAALAGVGISAFLVPNGIFDGGVVGIALIADRFQLAPLPLLLVVFNLPFVAAGWWGLSRRTAVLSGLGIAGLAYFTYLFHDIGAATDDLFLSAVFGGITVGAGVGIVLRTGGAMDGTEIAASLINRFSQLSVGQIILGFNVLIFAAAGAVFSWEAAMYSGVTYFIASRVIDLIVEGIDEARAVVAITTEPEQVASALNREFERGATLIAGRGAYSGRDRTIIYSVVSRLEVPAVRSVIRDMDPAAVVTVQHIQEVMGGHYVPGRDVSHNRS